jgi:hypothetical protein
MSVCRVPSKISDFTVAVEVGYVIHDALRYFKLHPAVGDAVHQVALLLTIASSIMPPSQATLEFTPVEEIDQARNAFYVRSPALTSL